MHYPKNHLADFCYFCRIDVTDYNSKNKKLPTLTFLQLSSESAIVRDILLSHHRLLMIFYLIRKNKSDRPGNEFKFFFFFFLKKAYNSIINIYVNDSVFLKKRCFVFLKLLLGCSILMIITILMII